MCDSNLKIMDIVTRWPGSTHDSRILKNSKAYHLLASGEYNSGIVLGDNGYENNNFIITPLSPTNVSYIVFLGVTHF